MAYCGSPQDLFASDDSDSDATVDLSVLPGTGSRCATDKDIVITVSDSDSMLHGTEQSQDHRSRRRRSQQHTVSSSDSEESSHHSAYPSSPNNKCLLDGPGSMDSLGMSNAAETLSTITGADKRVMSSQQLATDQLHDRPMCKYGVNCYRRNPSHFQEFRHPGNLQLLSCFFSALDGLITVLKHCPNVNESWKIAKILPAVLFFNRLMLFGWCTMSLTAVLY